MPLRQFADEAEITVQAGKGGQGCASFLRLRSKFGSPNGGDGGTGGDVVLVASPSHSTLRDFRYRRIFKAMPGQAGQRQRQQGRRGEDLIIEVPPGTLVYDAETGEMLVDLTHKGDRLIVARGGQGGKGNSHFSSSRNQSPKIAQPGEEGEQRHLRLELRVLADVGLLGLPNAGKTTLLTQLTASNARPAAYPFSTLEPNLGVISHEIHDPIVLADIPGLITGAHQGKGLGDRFLRHLQRSRLLVHIVDSTQLAASSPLIQVEKIEEELRAYDPHLIDKPRLVVLNKVDLLPAEFPLIEILAAIKLSGRRCLAISALTGLGVEELRIILREELEKISHESEYREGRVPATDHPEG
jgi:GTP-binding protein